MQHFQQSNAGVYRVPDSVQFSQDQITDVPEMVAVHLWLDLTITDNHGALWCVIIWKSTQTV